jgi:hypothetical protein
MAFAQSRTLDSINNESKTQAPPDEESHNTKDLDKLLERYNTDSKKVLEDNSKINDGEDASKSEVLDSDIEKMKPSEDPVKSVSINVSKKTKEDIAAKIAASKANSSELSTSVRIALEPLQRLSEKELLKRLDESTKDSSVRPYMDKFPNFTVFVVRLIKDKESIPSVVKILENRDRLIRFVGVMIGTLVFAFILKRVMRREGRSFIRSAFYFILRSFIMFGIRVFIIYWFFGAELAPVMKIFNHTFI